MLTISEVARDFTAMLRAGQFEAAGVRHCAATVTSVEPSDRRDANPARVSGLAAHHAASERWSGATRIDDLSIDGPFVTGNQFALFIDMVVVDRATGRGRPFDTIALFTVHADKITEERYFYD